MACQRATCCRRRRTRYLQALRGGRRIVGWMVFRQQTSSPGRPAPKPTDGVRACPLEDRPELLTATVVDLLATDRRLPRLGEERIFRRHLDQRPLLDRRQIPETLGHAETDTSGNGRRGAVPSSSRSSWLRAPTASCMYRSSAEPGGLSGANTWCLGLILPPAGGDWPQPSTLNLTGSETLSNQCVGVDH